MLDDDDDSDGEGKEAGDRVPEGRDIESSGESDVEDVAQKSLFVNPLAKLSGARNNNEAEGKESEEWSDDNLSDGGKKSKSKKGKKKDTVLGKRKRKGSIDDVRDFFNTEKIEEVPANDPGTLAQQQNGGYESMDSDEIAATRILARKMLRKKARNEMIEGSYNRYTTHEDPSTLPSWFVEDEARHRFCERFQPTKEEMTLEKEAIKAYNARPSKKVEQAKARKRKRLAKAMQKIKKKAQVIAD